MTPGARLQAAIELLDRIASARQPADQLIKAWGAANRYAGSKDRKAIAERVYVALRQPPTQSTGLGESGRGRVLASLALHDGLSRADIAALFSGVGHSPQVLTADEDAALEAPASAPLPALLLNQLERTFGRDAALEAEALLSTRAPLDIRINSLRSDIGALLATFAEIGITAEPTPFSARGLRLAGAPDLAPLDVFKAGNFEVQDEGSQLCAIIAASHNPSLVVDYCAGGGGKTLALAAEDRRLVACDINAQRLEAIKPRLARAGVAADLRKLGPKGEGVQDLVGQADLVLVDAPCTGSGTWRRRPEEAWRLTREDIVRFAKTQAMVLDRAQTLVRPGGRLAYVTCSVLNSENGKGAAQFLARHPKFRPVPIQDALDTDLLTSEGRARLAALASGGHTLQLSPRRTGTDGFFIALFERIP